MQSTKVLCTITMIYADTAFYFFKQKIITTNNNNNNNNKKIQVHLVVFLETDLRIAMKKLGTKHIQFFIYII
mgnify:CR=1 FL=1